MDDALDLIGRHINGLVLPDPYREPTFCDQFRVGVRITRAVLLDLFAPIFWIRL